MKSLILPALKGRFGSWVYFQTSMKIKDIMPDRIITVPESEELYSSNLNKVLQRDLESKRLDKIKDYLLRIDDRFFSSLIVAIHGGEPQWSNISLGDSFGDTEEKDLENISSKLGILRLAGSEEMFVLDGQHRLMGIRKAFKENPELIGSDEISVVLVLHKSRERTRRLFTVLNRYAVRIKPAEEIILEEDDAAAIITRRLVQEHEYLSRDNAISKSYRETKSMARELRATRAFSMPSSDFSSFTTLVCVYKVAQTIIDYKFIHPVRKAIKRPSDKRLDELFSQVSGFWDFVFREFLWIEEFIGGQTVKDDKGRVLNRNKESGGSIILRPEGHIYLAEIYKRYSDDNSLQKLRERLNQVDWHLSAPIWKHVFWEGKMLSKNKPLKRKLLSLMLGESVNKLDLERELKKRYVDVGADYPGLDRMLSPDSI